MLPARSTKLEAVAVSVAACAMSTRMRRRSSWADQEVTVDRALFMPRTCTALRRVRRRRSPGAACGHVLRRRVDASVRSLPALWRA